MASLNEIGGIVYSALIMIGSICSYSMYICYGNNVMFKRKHFKQGKQKLTTANLKEERNGVQAKLLCKEVGQHDETRLLLL